VKGTLGCPLPPTSQVTRKYQLRHSAALSISHSLLNVLGKEWLKTWHYAFSYITKYARSYEEYAKRCYYFQYIFGCS